MKHFASIALLLSSPTVITAANDNKNEDKQGNDKKPGKKTDSPTLSPSEQPTPSPTLSPSVSAPPSSNSAFSEAVNETMFNETAFGNETFIENGTQSPTATPLPSLLPSHAPSLSAQPSYPPTATPTLSPSAVPSSFPSSSPTLSNAPSAAPWTYTRPPRPTVRFAPWPSLDSTAKEAAQNLGYDPFTWENYGTNDVEYWGWEGMSEAMKENATLLGYDQRSWDCWQNHYESYRWIDLAVSGIQVHQFYEVLGYNISYWAGYTNSTITSSESRYWYDLTNEERYAASQLCYIRRSWDEDDVVYSGMFPMERPGFRFVEWDSLEDDMREEAVELGYENVTWNVLGLAVVEERMWSRLTKREQAAALAMGWTDISWDCWNNHFRQYSWDDLTLYGLDFHFTALGWDQSSWEGNSDPPSSHGKYWDLLNDVERENANALCFYRDNWDRVDMTPNYGPFPFRLPAKRYVPWKELPNADRQRAYDSLFYDECTWDVFGVADIEQKEWQELTAWEKSEATKLGFIPNSWDCFQNHYKQKKWHDINWDIRDAMAVLGWSEAAWSNQTLPQVYGTKWEGLTGAEQVAANKICYFNVNWPGGTDATDEEVESFIEEVQEIQSLPKNASILATIGFSATSDADMEVIPAKYISSASSSMECILANVVVAATCALLALTQLVI